MTRCRGFAFDNETCADVNECLSEGGNPCLDGDCVNLEPDYECLCYAGFQGDYSIDKILA